MKTISKKLLFLLLLLPLSVLAQSTVSGVVTDKSSGQPLPGVNVIIKGTTKGTTTDFDGKYMLSNVNSGEVIEFSFVGYQTTDVPYTVQNTINISLGEEVDNLEEVVLIGYGSVKKKDATGSVTQVTSKEFNKGAIVSADQLLTGKAAGVRITSNGGQPDAAPNIRIRGGSSISANNNPLIVIDGIPVDNVNPAGVGNPLSLINPNDIESFTVLKDASATAIYGSRASNGVIIITTKKGSKGAPTFNYSSNLSYGQVGKKVNVMNSGEFVRFIQEYHPTFTNLLGVADPDAPIGTTDDLATPQIEGRIIYDTDWQDAIFRNSFSTDHNFSANANLGGKVPFRGSFGYTKNEGLVKTNDYERFTYSLKFTPTLLKDHLKIDFNLKGVHSLKNNIDEGGALGGAINMDPTKPIYDNSPSNIFGGYYQDLLLNGNRNILNGQSNPLALLEQKNNPQKNQRLLTNVEFDYKMHFLPELRAIVNLGLDASQSLIRENFGDNSIATYRHNQGTNPNTNYVFNPGLNYFEKQRITNTTMDAYLAYGKRMENSIITNIDIQGGYSYQNFKNDGFSDRFRYNIDSGIREPEINEQNPTNRYYNVLNLQSYFGRMNLDLVNKYLFTFSLRADGSSLFREENRWGYFPAAAVAWKVKEETFLRDSKAVNDLKIRLGWGKTGQQDITGIVGYYPSIPLFGLGSNASQYLPGSNLYSAIPFNEDLTWEKTTSYNVGIDFDLFKNSFLTGSLDFYSRETSDLLARVDLPPGQGLTNAFVKNVGNTDSKGFELNLGLKLLKTESTSLEFNSNMAYNFSEVTNLEDVQSIQAGESRLPVQTGLFLANHAVGQQPYSAWVFRQLYDGSGNPVVGAYVDRNGDGQITNEDRYYKALRPNWTFGFGFNFNYKNWDLSSSFRGQIGGQVYNSRKLTSGWVDKALPVNNNSLSNVLDFYSGEADDNFININGNIPLSDYFLEDATFLRCENIILGYRFNKFYKSTSLRVYAALNNPFIITKYSGQDPENFNSIDNNFYPRPRVYTVGLSFDF
ncbi:SusC/RagA family TonB-linked outer membrane protein [Flavobacterium azooxidireducens]|uniref:SusC/RagA family TonB-linked outer membrane protein n=1 Tax=Flavobacterium azooxidireducens TaxID=1871076 RepID=A0ABY4KAG0_9FLAO|nr:SusC/RagA family TonB-linked outer membrane protein [Flavobacterium azooxidireducens]UPQ77781.1 SusC/RagA family TonB-linked outer membrane protein [Flavobacterium azooxidireducens]